MAKRISELSVLRKEDVVNEMAVSVPPGAFKKVNVDDHLFHDQDAAEQRLKEIYASGHVPFIMGFKKSNIKI